MNSSQERSPIEVVRTVYGERPITELFVTVMRDADFVDMVRRVRLTDGKQIDFDPELNFEEIFIEAPLGGPYGCVDLLFETSHFCMMCEVKPNAYDDIGIRKRLEDQIPRYLEVCRTPPKGNLMPLVERVTRKASSKRTFLIAMTGDERFPDGLREFLASLDSQNDPHLGWMSYSFLREVLAREGYEIQKTPPHIWISWPA